MVSMFLLVPYAPKILGSTHSHKHTHATQTTETCLFTSTGKNRAHLFNKLAVKHSC